MEEAPLAKEEEDPPPKPPLGLPGEENPDDDPELPPTLAEEDPKLAVDWPAPPGL